MPIVVVGVNHKSAPIELRERLAFRREQLPEAFAKLKQDIGLAETAILSTCNRVEIYGQVPDLNGTIEHLHQFLSAHGGLPLEALKPSVYSYTEPSSIQHLFSVASGLDSMVLGESEILSQVKHAYLAAQEAGATGKVFNALFQRALNAAKAVRTDTSIAQGCLSVGSVSVELAEKIFGHLSSAVVLLVGAGKIGETTAKRLIEQGVRDLRIVNRTAAHCAQLSDQLAAKALPLEALPEQLLASDIVITSTSAPSHLITKAHVAETMRKRHQRSLCLIDLGVPRNIEPSAGDLENVYLFDVDNLQGLVDAANRQRQDAAAHGRVIIDRKVQLFISWLDAERSPCPAPTFGSEHAAAP